MTLSPAIEPNQRVALVIQYAGERFCGWQRQAKGRTVQQELETAIALEAGYDIVVHAAGRTDAGVHAAAQVAHFDVNSPVPANKWATILNRRLPEDILVRASAAVPFDWHARFSAIWRRYRYSLYTHALPNLFVRPFVWHYYRDPLDDELMRQALAPLAGRLHLSAFRRAGSSRPHSWVEVRETQCYRQGPFLHVEVEASGFLYGMMRLLVGQLVQVGIGRRSLADFCDIWRNDRRQDVKHAAPAKGLCLLRVGYPQAPFAPDAWLDAMPKFAFDAVGV